MSVKNEEKTYHASSSWNNRCSQTFPSFGKWWEGRISKCLNCRQMAGGLEGIRTPDRYLGIYWHRLEGVEKCSNLGWKRTLGS